MADDPNTDNGDPTEDERDLRYRIERAFGNMPFMGGSLTKNSRTSLTPEPMTMEQIADNMETMVRVMQDVAEQYQEMTDYRQKRANEDRHMASYLARVMPPSPLLTLEGYAVGGRLARELVDRLAQGTVERTTGE